MSDERIGVFVCHCGSNIAGVIDVEALAEYAKGLPGVVYSEHNLYTCSDAGLASIKKGVREEGLNRVVVAACTPRTHGELLKKTCEEAGLNPYLFQFVNIREQCAWVHSRDRERANDKARDLLRMGVARVVLLKPKEDIEIQVFPRAVVIGGGIAGISSALSLARRGLPVTLVEKERELGGVVKELNKLYPSLEDASSFISSKVDELLETDNVEVLTETLVRELKGFMGNYEVLLQRAGSDPRWVKAGVILVATGAQALEPEGMYNFDGNRVIHQLQLEKLLRENRFTAQRVVMIQCVGARSEERPYCSRICCMTALKNALLIKQVNPQSQVFVLYRDIQTAGSEGEEYYSRARDSGIAFVKYSPERPPVVEEKKVKVFDQMLGEHLEIPYDLVVLTTPMVPRSEAKDQARLLKVPLDENGFFLEAHIKLQPVEFSTSGIYLCGCAHWPVHVSDAVAQAYAAAAKASVPLLAGSVKVEPIVARVEESLCTGCGLCESLCPYDAIRVSETLQGRKASVVDASCKGCGACGAACPEQAIVMQHFTDEQLLAEIKALVKAE